MKNKITLYSLDPTNYKNFKTFKEMLDILWREYNGDESKIDNHPFYARDFEKFDLVTFLKEVLDDNKYKIKEALENQIATGEIFIKDSDFEKFLNDLSDKYESYIEFVSLWFIHNANLADITIKEIPGTFKQLYLTRYDFEDYYSKFKIKETKDE